MPQNSAGAVTGWSALGAFWRFLRQDAGLTQEQLVMRLRALGLHVSVKQVWGWEKGVNRPMSVSKARVDEALRGDPRVSDRLLVYDEEQVNHMARLRATVANKQLPSTLRNQAREELFVCATAAMNHGVAAAKQWILERQTLEVRRIVSSLPIEVTERFEATLATLAHRDLLVIEEWLRYGAYLEQACPAERQERICL